MRAHLEALHKAGQPVTMMNYDDAVQRAEMAASFVQHPYWLVMSRMLSGTIQNETEQLLAGDEHMAVNRASVAICRKVIHMPYIDIEQGQLAQREYLKAQTHRAKRRFSQLG